MITGCNFGQELLLEYVWKLFKCWKIRVNHDTPGPDSTLLPLLLASLPRRLMSLPRLLISLPRRLPVKLPTSLPLRLTRLGRRLPGDTKILGIGVGGRT